MRFNSIPVNQLECDCLNTFFPAPIRKEGPFLRRGRQFLNGFNGAALTS
jgi:hypothetical protein